VTIDANVDDYRVELYSPRTAQKWMHDCPEAKCIIEGVSPFDYNISIIKTDYDTIVISAKISARNKETIVVQLEKNISLVSIGGENTVETNKQKIQRLREEKLYYSRFQLDDDILLTFKQQEDQLLLQYRTPNNMRDIWNFKLVEKDDILIDSIPETWNIFLSLGDEYYVFDTQKFSLHLLNFGLEINYIKWGGTKGMYLIVTDKWTFLYDIIEKTSEFQYLFKDFLYAWDDIIWIIYEDEEQKKSNFNLSDSWNLIIRYSPKAKTRKIVETTKLNIDRLEWRGEKIIFSERGNEYELWNF
jgi:hypothetical protein